MLSIILTSTLTSQETDEVSRLNLDITADDITGLRPFIIPLIYAGGQYMLARVLSDNSGVFVHHWVGSRAAYVTAAVINAGQVSEHAEVPADSITLPRYRTISLSHTRKPCKVTIIIIIFLLGAYIISLFGPPAKQPP